MVAVKKERFNYQYPDQRVESEVQKAKVKKPLSPVLTSCLLVVALVAMGITVIYRHSVVHYHNQELHRMKTTYAELVDEQNHLLIEGARLRSLSRIDKIATEDLGLRPPGPEQIIVVNRATDSGDDN